MYNSIRYLYSIGDLSKNQESQLAGIQWDKHKGYILAYHIFGLLWTSSFIVAIEQFVVSSCAAFWYYSAGVGQSSHNPVLRSYYRVFAYHLGSIAFGSLALALIKGVRVLLEYADAKATTSVRNAGICIRFRIKCARCIVVCFERFIRFLNKHAYTHIALSGSSFCAAAQEGFYVLTTSQFRFAILKGVGSVFFFFGQMFITVATTILCYLIVTQTKYYRESLFSPVLPTIFFFFIAYMVSELVIEVYDMTANTLLHCFCIDEKVNNGYPRFPPKALKDYAASLANKK
eukprot:TRINITY_DN4878_c0_g3_i8.p1 TRINITY_DN4878_c0_g3~~TRINITY_DN4878_c0_g3_i8.p1  ORF type:complete len:288 (-),score=13.10 TRINITY_DN4878_c0_g3_i8:3-866(-)